MTRNEMTEEEKVKRRKAIKRRQRRQDFMQWVFYAITVFVITLIVDRYLGYRIFQWVYDVWNSTFIHDTVYKYSISVNEIHATVMEWI